MRWTSTRRLIWRAKEKKYDQIRKDLEKAATDAMVATDDILTEFTLAHSYLKAMRINGHDAAADQEERKITGFSAGQDLRFAATEAARIRGEIGDRLQKTRDAEMGPENVAKLQEDIKDLRSRYDDLSFTVSGTAMSSR